MADEHWVFWQGFTEIWIFGVGLRLFCSNGGAFACFEVDWRRLLKGVVVVEWLEVDSRIGGWGEFLRGMRGSWWPGQVPPQVHRWCFSGPKGPQAWAWLRIGSGALRLLSKRTSSAVASCLDWTGYQALLLPVCVGGLNLSGPRLKSWPYDLRRVRRWAPWKVDWSPWQLKVCTGEVEGMVGNTRNRYLMLLMV